MKKFLSSVGVILLSFVLTAVANAEGGSSIGAGNGGDGLVCRDSGGRVLSVELLESYEAREIFGIKLEFPDMKSSSGSNIRSAIAEIEARYFDLMSSKNLGIVGDIDISTFFKTALPADLISPIRWNFPSLPSLRYQLPSGCKLELLAVKRTGWSLAPGYFYDRTLLTHLSPEQKLLLALHETLQPSKQSKNVSLTRQIVIATFANAKFRAEIRAKLQDAHFRLQPLLWDEFCRDRCGLTYFTPSMFYGSQR